MDLIRKFVDSPCGHFLKDSRGSMAGKGVLAIGEYGLCITLAAGASATSSLHFVPCAAASSESEHPLL